MNIVEHLMKATNRSILTIEKFDASDLSNSHSIRFIVDNESTIKGYFDEKGPLNLEDAEAYYDFLFLKYVTKFQIHIEEIPLEFGEPLKQLIDYATVKLYGVESSHIIKCIKKNYSDIFELSKRFTDMGLMNETLDFVIKYYSGFENCGLIEFLIEEYTYFIFDNFEKLYEIMKKNKNILKMLMVTNLDNITRMRFKDICDVIKKLYGRGITDIVEQSCLVLYDSIMKRYVDKEDVFFVQPDLKALYKTLYLCKVEKAKELIPIIKEVDKKIEERILKEGYEVKYEFSTQPYHDWMEKLRSAPTLFKFLNLTHGYNNETLLVSHIDEFSSSFTPSFLDIIATSPNTNKYFTRSRQKQFDILITCHSSKLLYWFSSKDLSSEFKQAFSTVIDSILEVVNHNTEFENIYDDINCFIEMLSEAIEHNKNGVNLFTKLLYIISFFEKILRMVYVSLDEKIFFQKNITLGSIFGTGDNINKVLADVLGEPHLRWTRYYLMKDDDNIGLDYRNRMAHLRDINPSKMSLFEFLKVVWIIISTLNSMLVNIVNNDYDEVTHFKQEETPKLL